MLARCRIPCTTVLFSFGTGHNARSPLALRGFKGSGCLLLGHRAGAAVSVPVQPWSPNLSSVLHMPKPLTLQALPLKPLSVEHKSKHLPLLPPVPLPLQCSTKLLPEDKRRHAMKPVGARSAKESSSQPQATPHSWFCRAGISHGEMRSTLWLHMSADNRCESYDCMPMQKLPRHR